MTPVVYNALSRLSAERDSLVTERDSLIETLTRIGEKLSDCQRLLSEACTLIDPEQNQAWSKEVHEVLLDSCKGEI